MFKRLTTAICGLAMLGATALAQDTACDPAKLAGAVDRYAVDPFGARTWRVLSGLGDPMIDPDYQGADYWSRQERWKKLAGQILPDAPNLQNFGFDCRIGYPLDVLEKRVAVLGRESQYVTQWLRVQEKVMQACSQPAAASVALPDPLEIHPDLAKMQADDRAYQEASIAFYRDKEKAVQLFRAIGSSDSEHRGAARYNVANLLANGKQLGEARAEAEAILADQSLAGVHVIAKELLGYIANLEDTAQGWSALIDDTVAILQRPAAEILATDASKTEYARALYDIDYAGVRGKDSDWWLDGTLPEDPTISKALVDSSRKYSMVLWMMAGQSADDAYRVAPWSLIGAKWQERMTSYIDKALAITPSGPAMLPAARDMLDSMRALPDESSRAELWEKAETAIAAASQTCGDAPATGSAGYLLSQATRLSAMTGDYDALYEKLQKVPFQASRAYAEGTVLRLAEYLLGQGNVGEARRMRDRLLTKEFFDGIPETVRTSVTDRFAEFLSWIAEDEARWTAAVTMHGNRTGFALLNFLPVSKLWELSESVSFSDAQRALFSRVAWTREYARGGTPNAEETAKLYALNPEIKAIADKVAADYPDANAQRQRLLTILRSPRFGILVNAPGVWEPIEEKRENFSEIDVWDHNDKNWWCPLEMNRQLGALRDEFDASAGIHDLGDYAKRRMGEAFDQGMADAVATSREAVLGGHPIVQNVSWKELRNLANMPSAPKLLSRSAIRWGKASRGGDGAPEALALAVRTTRYGCNWHGGHGSYSRAAQQLLRNKFPETAWAKQTPYWFDCQRSIWDESYQKITTCKPVDWPRQDIPR